jgi:hypothetical protein
MTFSTLTPTVVHATRVHHSLFNVVLHSLIVQLMCHDCVIEF